MKGTCSNRPVLPVYWISLIHKLDQATLSGINDIKKDRLQLHLLCKGRIQFQLHISAEDLYKIDVANLDVLWLRK